MKMKIIHRSSIIWNLILFMLLSFIFIYIQKAIFLEKSAFSLDFLKVTVLDNLYLLSSLVVTSLLIYKLKKICKIVYIGTVLFVSVYSVLNLFEEFSKLILVVLFLYFLLSYYFYFLLKSDLNLSFYNPSFDNNNLFDPMLFKINCSVGYKVNGVESSTDGCLTNWDDAGCFISLSSALPKNSIVNKLSISFDNQTFEDDVKVVTILKDREGLGLSFNLNKSHNIFNWNELNKIITDMGISVEYVK
jgi:hypothetical protein